MFSKHIGSSMARLESSWGMCPQGRGKTFCQERVWGKRNTNSTQAKQSSTGGSLPQGKKAQAGIQARLSLTSKIFNVCMRGHLHLWQGQKKRGKLFLNPLLPLQGCLPSAQPQQGPFNEHFLRHLVPCIPSKGHIWLGGCSTKTYWREHCVGQ